MGPVPLPRALAASPLGIPRQEAPRRPRLPRQVLIRLAARRFHSLLGVPAPPQALHLQLAPWFLLLGCWVAKFICLGFLDFSSCMCGCPKASAKRFRVTRTGNIVRRRTGKQNGMAAMYSWSCKRSYKNGFVWHDLAEDDLVLPATDGEYVLMDSEFLVQSSSGQFYHGSNGNQKQHGRLKEGARLPLPREASCSSSPPSVIVREAKPRRSPAVSLQDEDDSPLPCRVNSLENMSPELEPQRILLSRAGSASPAEFRVCKPTSSLDAATQTDDLGRRSVRKAPEMHKNSLSTDHDSVVHEITEYRQSHPHRSVELQGISKEVVPQCGTSLSVPSTCGPVLPSGSIF